MTVQPQCPGRDLQCEGRLSLRPDGDPDTYVCSRCARRWSVPEVTWLTLRERTLSTARFDVLKVSGRTSRGR